MPNSSIPTLRWLAVALAATLTCGTGTLHAQDHDLPDMGSSADTLITPAQEAGYGAQMLGELRRLGMTIEDPLLDEWIGNLGHRLAAYSDRPDQPFTFFLIRDRAINAFATLGGYIAMNTGLVLTAEREDEVAAVLAHEIAHATQRHIVRSVEAAQKDSLPILLGMLGAVVAAQQAGGDGDATQAAIAGGLALLQQRQINFTRSNEHEADRIGIGVLAKAGYDPVAMADFFGRMLRATRSQGDSVPDFLRTHPVTTTRISEAKDRAQRLQPTPRPALAPSSLGTLGSIDVGTVLVSSPGPDPRTFAFARERMRVLGASTAAEAASEYHKRLRAGDALNDAERYGMAIADMLSGQADRAATALEALSAQHPDLFWVELAHAEALHRAGRASQAEQAFETLLRRLPNSSAVAIAYASALAEHGTREHGQRAMEVLRPLLSSASYDPSFQRSFARAAELAGDIPRAAEAHAEAAFLSGRAEDALNQLQRLKERTDLDYVQRARVEARISAMTPIVLELRARGIRPDGSSRNNGSGLSLHADLH
ncbi:MAG: M48 family metallopeptidase [Xanthomonadales bacterium]|nr:M48 family metallopeptidase [Xanthomonadales bacterium]